MCADKIEITYAMQPDKIINKLYVELVSSIFSIFNNHPRLYCFLLVRVKSCLNKIKSFFW